MDIDLNPVTHPTLTLDEVAVVLGIARSSAYTAAHAGQIPTIRVGRRILVPTAALRSMLKLDELQTAG